MADTKFTTALIKKMAPRSNNTLAQQFPELLNELLPRYKINTPKRIAMFMARGLVETGELKRLDENLNYSAKRLMQVWPSRFKTLSHARKYERNPEKLANLVYNRYGNRGHKGWGWKYRGRGFFQTTFVDNYRIVQTVTGLPVVSNPDLLRVARTAIEAACIYWAKKNCNALADAGNLRQVVKVINGGTHGLTQTRNYYRKILPMVREFDLTNNVRIMSSAAGASAVSGAVATEGWIAVGIIIVAVVLISGYIGYRKYRRQKDVDAALAETKTKS